MQTDLGIGEILWYEKKKVRDSGWEEKGKELHPVSLQCLWGVCG